MAKQWFVARTKTGGELTASVAVAAKGFDVFLPVQMSRRSHARKVETISKPLFPRYLFVAFDPELEQHGQINYCRGVANRGLMLDGDRRPIPVPDKVIEAIRKREAADLAKAGEITTGYKPGEIFQLPRGHATVCATYIGEENGKVWVFIDLFGKQNMVPLDFEAVPPKSGSMAA